MTSRRRAGGPQAVHRRSGRFPSSSSFHGLHPASYYLRTFLGGPAQLGPARPGLAHRRVATLVQTPTSIRHLFALGAPLRTAAATATEGLSDIARVQRTLAYPTIYVGYSANENYS